MRAKAILVEYGFKLLFWFYRFLDWWNGSYLDSRGYLEIKYRYRLRSYVIQIPYSLTQGPQEIVIKDKIFPLPYQNGIKFLLDPQVLGYDQVRDYLPDD